MQELTFDQVEEVSGGAVPLAGWALVKLVGKIAAADAVLIAGYVGVATSANN